MTLAELIQELANRVNIDNDNIDLKTLVMNPNLSQINISDELSNEFQSKLMSEDQARINPNLNTHFKKHYIGTALKTVDSKIADLVNALELDDNYRSHFDNEQNTYNKIEMIAQLIKDNKSNNNKSNNKQDSDYDKQSLLNKINELTEQLNWEKESRDYYIQDINNDWKNRLSEKELNSIFSQYNYAMDIDKDIAVQTARTLVEKKLKEKGGMYTFDDQSGFKLVNYETPDLPFTIDNKQIDFKKFVDNVLAENKLLKVNTPAEHQQTNTQATINELSVLKANMPAPAARTQTSKAISDFIAGS
jgi:hypothetical protein